MSCTPWAGAEWPPRAWQRAALPIVLAAIDGGERKVVQACMGSGKSVLLAEVCAQLVGTMGRADVIVISTSTQALVEQLAATVRKRVGRHKVGRYYGRAKEVKAITITCNPSMGALATRLRQIGRTVTLWIADECHRTECPGVIDAVEVMAPAAAIGFTATPYRGTKREELSLFNELIVRYGPGDALRDGVVVPWVPVSTTEEGELDATCVEMIRDAVGPGVASASSIEDAIGFAAKLTEEGIPAEPVHSKMARAEIVKALKRLETGEIRCLVHVSLLQEGVDFPWLRWLCLRRHVKSRVRFAQEVGRVLRSAPGKAHAVVYDPHDLFGALRLSYAAVLQGGAEEVEDEDNPFGDDEVEPEDATVQGELDVKPPAPKFSVGLTPTEVYLHRLSTALDVVGVIEKSDGSWRDDVATPAQVEAIEAKAHALASVEIPDEHLAALRDVYRHRWMLAKGDASDFLSIIIHLPGTGWPSPVQSLMDAGELV